MKFQQSRHFRTSKLGKVFSAGHRATPLVREQVSALTKRGKVLAARITSRTPLVTRQLRITMSGTSAKTPRMLLTKTGKPVLRRRYASAQGTMVLRQGGKKTVYKTQTTRLKVASVLKLLRKGGS